jgi:prephenate dehydrogenase
MDAERHDSIVAAVSHVPYLVAANLAAAADEWASAEPELESVASSGFADTTRLAASSVDMMLDVLLTNRAAIVERLRELSRAQNELIDCIAEGDEAVLRKRLARAAARRRTWKGGPAHE